VVHFELPHLISQGAIAIARAHPWSFAATAFMGFFVNVLAVLVISLTSSLTLKVLGTVKDVVLVCIGMVFLQELVTGLQLAGYGVSLCGFVWYNFIKVKQAQHKQS
jgi:hypothetical protein